MSFEEFKNSARLYVIGALYPAELEDFENAATVFGGEARKFINDCCRLRDAFALSLKSPDSRAALNIRLMSITGQRRSG